MSTIDVKEIQNFSKDSSRWWDEKGPFRPLHKLNPTRIAYIKRQICAHYGLDERSIRPFKGLSVVDIGCGGGLVCEPLTRLAAEVTGIDADSSGILAAKEHAALSELDINYLNVSTDDLINQGQRYDVVLALEIVEHVADVDKFVEHCVDLCKPGGIIIFSTLNRTPKSFLLGKVAAEYVLAWVPKGTHDWQKFLKPSELARAVRNAGGNVENLTGMVYSPLQRNFTLSDDLAVNYFLSAVRA